MFKRKKRTRMAAKRAEAWHDRLEHLDANHNGDAAWRRRRRNLEKRINKAENHLARMERSKRLRWRRAHWRWEKAGTKVDQELHRTQ